MPRLALAALSAALFAAAPAFAQPEATQRPAIERPETATPAGAPPLTVSSTAVKAGGVIPLEFSRYGRNLSPPLTWAGAPRATKSYVILLEDPDSRPTLNTHWVAWNAPGVLGALSRGIRNSPEPSKPEGLRQGRNSHGGIGYTGPHPPLGDPPHHYHLQVFALDRTLGVGGGSDKEHVLGAMRGHVLAKGEVVGLYEAAAPPAPAPTTGPPAKPAPPAAPAGRS